MNDISPDIIGALVRRSDIFGAAAADASLDLLEAQMAQHGKPVETPLIHRFTPGLYIREILMPAGSLVTSRIHRTTHPYVISKGVISVWTKEDGVQHLRAPHTGITKPGTRRLLYAHEDTIWTTFHPTDETDVETIEAAILEPHLNPFLTDALLPEKEVA